MDQVLCRLLQQPLIRINTLLNRRPSRHPLRGKFCPVDYSFGEVAVVGVTVFESVHFTVGIGYGRNVLRDARSRRRLDFPIMILGT